MKYQHINQELAKVVQRLELAATDLNDYNHEPAVKHLREAKDWLSWAIVETERQSGTYKPVKAKGGLPVAIRDGLDDFAMQILEIKAMLFAASVADDMPEQALNLISGGERLVNLMEKDFDALHRGLIDATVTGNAPTTPAPAPAGTEAHALLSLLSSLLTQWRKREISGNEFEETLEQAVSIASSLAERDMSILALLSLLLGMLKNWRVMLTQGGDPFGQKAEFGKNLEQAVSLSSKLAGGVLS